MPSKSRKIRVTRSTSKAASTKTLPVETNPPANPETMLATPEQLAALNNKLGNEHGASTTEAVNLIPALAASQKNDDADNTQADLSDRALAKAAAQAAVAAFYNGTSFPFKAACDLRYRSAINFATGDESTARAAAGLAAIITYCDVKPDGTFVRGSGRVPGRLIGLTGKQASQTFAAGAESGLLSQLVSKNLKRVTYISGATHGLGVENSVFKLNFDAARVELLKFNSTRDSGGKLFSAPLRLLRVIETKAANATIAADLTAKTTFADNPPANLTDQPGDNVSDLPV